MTGDKVVGSRLRLFRKNITQLTQNEFGEVIGIGGNVVGRIESGNIGIDIEKLRILNIQFNLNINWLICGKSAPQLNDNEKKPYTDEVEKNESLQVAESKAEYQTNDSKLLTMQLESLTNERDLYKKLYEKQEIEVEYYKSQLKK